MTLSTTASRVSHAASMVLCRLAVDMGPSRFRKYCLARVVARRPLACQLWGCGAIDVTQAQAPTHQQDCFLGIVSIEIESAYRFLHA